MLVTFEKVLRKSWMWKFLLPNVFVVVFSLSFFLLLEFNLLTFGKVGEKEWAVEVSAAKWQFDENLMPPTQTSANFSFSQKYKYKCEF